MIILTATLQASEGNESELENALLGMIPKTAKEEGALEYRLHKSKSIPGNYFFYEKYTGQQALDSHLTTPHYKTLIETIGDLLAEAPAVDTFDFIEGIPE